MHQQQAQPHHQQDTPQGSAFSAAFDLMPCGGEWAPQGEKLQTLERDAPSSGDGATAAMTAVTAGSEIGVTIDAAVASAVAHTLPGGCAATMPGAGAPWQLWSEQSAGGGPHSGLASITSLQGHDRQGRFGFTNDAIIAGVSCQPVAEA